MKAPHRDKLIELIAEGDLKPVFEYIFRHGLEKSSRDLVLMKANYESVHREYRLSAISFEEYTREINKIKIAVLDWADRDDPAPPQPAPEPETASAAAAPPPAAMPAQAPAEGAAMLIVERERAYASSLRDMGVYVDGEKLGTLANGQTGSYRVAPGRRRIHVKISGGTSDPIYLDFSANQSLKVTAGTVMMSMKPFLKG